MEAGVGGVAGRQCGGVGRQEDVVVRVHGVAQPVLHPPHTTDLRPIARNKLVRQ